MDKFVHALRRKAAKQRKCQHEREDRPATVNQIWTFCHPGQKISLSRVEFGVAPVYAFLLTSSSAHPDVFSSFVPAVHHWYPQQADLAPSITCPRLSNQGAALGARTVEQDPINFTCPPATPHRQQPLTGEEAFLVTLPRGSGSRGSKINKRILQKILHAVRSASRGVHNPCFPVRLSQSDKFRKC